MLKSLSSILIAGGGTFGHVGPMLSVSQELLRRNNKLNIVAIGTICGIERKIFSNIQRIQLEIIPRTPFPRKLDNYLYKFPKEFLKAVHITRRLLIKNKVQVVFGVGGYVAMPAYLAAFFLKIPYVIHEANIMPGMANKFAARYAFKVGTTFKNTPIRNAVFAGMPMSNNIISLNRKDKKSYACSKLGLDPSKKTIMIMGGSLGAKKFNRTLVSIIKNKVFDNTNIQIIHIVGFGNRFIMQGENINYHQYEFISDIENAYATADIIVSRAGAGAVSEICILGIPAIFVPLATGNGEQYFNAKHVVDAGGALMIDDNKFNPHYFRTTVIPLLNNTKKLEKMSKITSSLSKRNAHKIMADIIEEALLANEYKN